MTGNFKSKSVKVRLNALREHLGEGADISEGKLMFEQRRLLDAVEKDRLKPYLSRSGLRWVKWGGTFAAAGAAAVFLFALVITLLFYGTGSGQRQVPRVFSGLFSPSDVGTFFSGSLATVPKAQGAKIVWPDRTAVWLHENTRMRVLSEDTDTVELVEGRLLAAVKPRNKGRSFRAKTPLGTVTVHGTVFSVSVRGGRVVVRLYEGAVSFASQGTEVSLNPGYELHVEQGNALKTRPLDDTGVLSDLMIAEKTAELEGPPVPLLMLSRSEEIAPIASDTAPSPPPETDEPVSHRPAKKPSRPTKSAPSETDTDEPSRSMELFVDPSLNEIEVTSAPDVKAGVHEEDPTPRIEALMRQGDFAGCIDTADAYLKKFQGGVHAERVQFLKGSCQTKSGDFKAGREAFERYLIRFPDGRQWQKVNEILGE